ncbi:MAG: hypothetical protein LBL91_00365 [Lachnospiraceae bacterium]|nr:hypothetical protein [Lachnospiraceae bacterium]
MCKLFKIKESNKTELIPISFKYKFVFKIGDKIGMLVLSKKRILMVFICIIISIGAFGLMNYSKEIDKTAPVVALPVNSKVIILDAGHGNPDGRSC